MARILNAKTASVRERVVIGLILPNRGGDPRLCRRRNSGNPLASSRVERLGGAGRRTLLWTALRDSGGGQRNDDERRVTDCAQARTKWRVDLRRTCGSDSHDAYPSLKDQNSDPLKGDETGNNVSTNSHRLRPKDLPRHV